VGARKGKTTAMSQPRQVLGPRRRGGAVALTGKHQNRPLAPSDDIFWPILDR
jgi:hypothetical protein